MSKENREYEHKGHTYVIDPIDAMTGSRLAMLYNRGLSNLPEAEYKWVQAKALGVVSRYEVKGEGDRIAMPIFASGQIVPQDLKNDGTSLTILMAISLNWNVMDDFFDSSATETLLPAPIRAALQAAKEKSLP